MCKKVENYLDNLSEVQRAAVTSIDGASLIVAGAGSGKTRVLTCRIAYMLEQGIAPGRILALTFTNKAAAEMKERMARYVAPELVARLRMGTFHSVFSRIIRAESHLLGFPNTFTIYEPGDCKNVLKMIVKEMNLNEEQYKPQQLLTRISLAKNNLVLPSAYRNNQILCAEDRERKQPLLVDIYEKYMDKCKQFGAMDFDDLLLYMNILFRDFPDVLEKYRNIFSHVLVDEYQDTNSAQYLVIKKLAHPNGNICVVGDDSQSIYSFRGAKIENILRFQNDFPQASVFKLEQNYRSTQNIVNAANSLIVKNKNRLEKTVFSTNDVGEKIKVVKAASDKEESMLVTSDIYATARSKSLDYSSFAILYRTNSQSRGFEESLRRMNIPYKIRGGMSFYQRKEIKDILAYVRLIVNKKDDEALYRIINYPTRGIGDVTKENIRLAAHQADVSMWEVIDQAAKQPKVLVFRDLIAELTALANSADALTVVREIATRTGIIGQYSMNRTPENISVLENIEELINSVKSFVDSANDDGMVAEKTVMLSDWLENVSLMTDEDDEQDNEHNYVTLMTIHSAKGLEFDNVYVVGLENNLFPSRRSFESATELEEERRLFYVAITRARHRLMLSHCAQRFQWGDIVANPPSLFLKEIDSEYLDIKSNDLRPRTAGAVESRVGQPDLRNVRSMGVARPETKREITSSGDLSVGCTVLHDKFGRGRVVLLENSTAGDKVTVEFAQAGRKVLLVKFAKLKVIS